MRNIKKRNFINISMLLIVLLFFSCKTLDNTDDIPGDINAFDPIASISEISAFAGENVYLMEINAFYIKPDGTIDVEAEYEPTIIYHFLRKIIPEVQEDNPDLPVGVSQTQRNTAERVETITIKIVEPYYQELQTSDNTGDIYYDNYKHKGMGKESRFKPFSVWMEIFQISEAAKPPLSFKTIWEKAVDAGAPANNTVAVIKFRVDNGYTFEIKDTDFKYKFDITGKMIN